MEMPRWGVLALVLLAGALAAIALLDLTAPAPDVLAPCSGAKVNPEKGLTRQAEQTYLAILKKEPTSQCARSGMDAVSKVWCDRGNELLTGKAYVDAVKVFNTLLEEEPLGKPRRQCMSAELRTSSLLPPSSLY